MIRRIDHINIVVQNLDAMVDFYTRLLGFVVTKDVTIAGPWIDQVVGLTSVNAHVIYLDPHPPGFSPVPPEFPPGTPNPGSSPVSLGPRIELIRYNHPQTDRPPGLDQPNVPGLRHLAFDVDAIDPLVEKLRAAGVRFFSDIQQVPTSQVTYAGGIQKYLVYFADPEGNLLELCEYRPTP